MSDFINKNIMYMHIHIQTCDISAPFGTVEFDHQKVEYMYSEYTVQTCKLDISKMFSYRRF